MQYCYKQNRFQQLRGFCYSAMAGSITEGARRLHLSQPSVTQQIQALEREMGVQLFERRQGGIKLTREGEALFAMSMALVEQIESLEQRFNRSRAKAGAVRIATAPELLFACLLPILDKCRRERPQLQVRLLPLAMDWGLGGQEEADFALGPKTAFHPENLGSGKTALSSKGEEGVEFHPVARSGWTIISPHGHPLGQGKREVLEEMEKYPLVLPPRGTPLRAAIDSAFAKSGLSVEPSIEVEGISLITRLVAKGYGVSIVPSLCLEEAESLQSTDVSRCFPSMEYGIIHCANRELSPQARHVISKILCWAEMDSVGNRQDRQDTGSASEHFPRMELGTDKASPSQSEASSA